MSAITSVWSSYGHTFMSEDDYESCLTCGALFELVADPADDTRGDYRAVDGSEPSRCSGDTSQVHGYTGEIEGEPDPNCNCHLCHA